MSELQEYKCPCCGGGIGFDSNSQTLKCPYCDTEFGMDDIKSYDEVLKNEMEDDFSWKTQAGTEWTEADSQGLQTFVCKSCGGEIIGDANTAATECPYCGNPIVVMNRFSGMLKPDYVIPFKLDREAAMGKFKKHLQGKKLLPKAFTEQHHLEEIKGIYVPYWLFDADTKSHIRYKGTKVSRWSDSKFDYTRTDYFTILRGGDLDFCHVPVDGSSKMDDELMESLEPYDFKDAVSFQTAYLAGYFADKYDVDSEASVNRANERIKRATEDAFRATVTGFDTVNVERSSVQLINGVAKYAMYPVWILNTTWKGQKFVFAMNGQTGKFVGNLPMDKSLFGKYFLKATAIVSVITFVIELLFALI